MPGDEAMQNNVLEYNVGNEAVCIKCMCALLQVEEDDTRVFILNMYALHARTILCQVSTKCEAVLRTMGSRD